MIWVWEIAEAFDLPSCEMPWDLEPLEGFGSSLSGTRLDPVGAMTNALLRDELKEQRVTVCLGVAERAGAELTPQLRGVLEAQHPRRSIVLGGSLSHQQTDQVIGQQGYPQLLFRPWQESGNAAPPCRAWS